MTAAENKNAQQPRMEKKEMAFAYHPVHSIEAMLRHYATYFFPTKWADGEMEKVLQDPEIAKLNSRLQSLAQPQCRAIAVGHPNIEKNKTFAIESYCEELVEYQEFAIGTNGLAFARNIHIDQYKDSLLIVEFDTVTRVPLTYTRFLFTCKGISEPTMTLRAYGYHSASDTSSATIVDKTSFCRSLLPISRFKQSSPV